MIYFDNAATTKYKPEVVYDAANYYMHEIGVCGLEGIFQVYLLLHMHLPMLLVILCR